MRGSWKTSVSIVVDTSLIVKVELTKYPVLFTQEHGHAYLNTPPSTLSLLILYVKIK